MVPRSIPPIAGPSHSIPSKNLMRLLDIERALRSMRTKDYGLCRRCRKSIPDERLTVQPNALVGMPCLARAERNPVEE